MGINTREPDVAALLKLPEPYQLLGFFDPNPQATPMERFAFVKLIDCDPSHFATFRVVNDDGKCELGHYFGADEFNAALKDFIERARIGELLGRARAQAVIHETSGKP